MEPPPIPLAHQSDTTVRATVERGFMPGGYARGPGSLLR